MADARFWAAFLDWHVRTEHPWDLALHLTAAGMAIEGVGRDIGELLRPAIDKAAAALQEWADRYPLAAA